MGSLDKEKILVIELTLKSLHYTGMVRQLLKRSTWLDDNMEVIEAIKDNKVKFIVIGTGESNLNHVKKYIKQEVKKVETLNNIYYGKKDSIAKSIKMNILNLCDTYIGDMGVKTDDEGLWDYWGNSKLDFKPITNNNSLEWGKLPYIQNPSSNAFYIDTEVTFDDIYHKDNEFSNSKEITSIKINFDENNNVEIITEALDKLDDKDISDVLTYVLTNFKLGGFEKHE